MYWPSTSLLHHTCLHLPCSYRTWCICVCVWVYYFPLFYFIQFPWEFNNDVVEARVRHGVPTDYSIYHSSTGFRECPSFFFLLFFFLLLSACTGKPVEFNRIQHRCRPVDSWPGSLKQSRTASNLPHQDDQDSGISSCSVTPAASSHMPTHVQSALCILHCAFCILQPYQPNFPLPRPFPISRHSWRVWVR